MPASRQATGVEFPCAIDTSIWRSSVTICSALNLFFGMTQAPFQAILSQRLVQKSPVRSLLKFVLSDALPALHQGRTVIRKARAEVTERRSKLKIEGPDKTDIAAAFRRMEIRTRLNNMKPDELTNYFARYGDNLPTEIAQAVTELPPEYSDVTQSRHDLLVERALNAQYGDAIAEIKEIEQGIEAAESSVEASRDEIRVEVGIHDPAKFNELAAPVEAKQDAPWLRRGKDTNGNEAIRVVDLDRGVERVPTADEIVRGIFYSDFEHYKEGKAA
jgi:hypothetical protein